MRPGRPAALAFAFVLAGALALGFTVALAVAAPGGVAAAARAPRAQPARSVLVVFVDAAGPRPPAGAGLSPGLVSAAQQAGYSRAQFLLDVTQGARVGAPTYSPPTPGALRLTALAPVPSATTGAHAGAGPARIQGWAAARRRAAAAAGRLQPGLLAASVPGGAAYAGPQAPGANDIDAVLAAGTDGRIADVALGGDDSLPARIDALRRTYALVVADLPAGARGRADLARLARDRVPGELLVAIQRARTGGELLWAALAGTPGQRAPGELESASTLQRGLVSAMDLAPTLLRHLGAGVPGAMQGRAIAIRGKADPAALARLEARLRAIPGRRLPALAALLAACALLVAACAARPRARRRALRIGALALLWSPSTALLAAAIEPGEAGEYALITATALALGLGTDALLRWPRALIAPALAAPCLIALDAFVGTQLQMRSLAGPDPVGGARFYGIGNELKSALAVMVLAGAAAALYPLRRRGAAAAALGACGLWLLVVEGWARIGAGVGGALLVAGAFGLATAMTLAAGRDRGAVRVPGAPGGAGRAPTGARATPAVLATAAALVVLAALAGLAVLVAIDLATAHGRGHLQGSVLDARSAADLRDELANRYASAWRALLDPAMAVATVAALALAAAGVRLRSRLLAPVGGDAPFAAAFAGGLLAGVAGALLEDSGPLLLVQAVLALACVAAYLHAGPPQTAPAQRERAYASSSAAPSTAAERPTIAVLGGSQGTA